MEHVDHSLNAVEIVTGIQEEDLLRTITELRGSVANYKLKLQDFYDYVKIMETEKIERVRENNKKHSNIAKMIMLDMTALHEKLLVDLTENDGTEIDPKISKLLWETTESTALNMIEKLKFIYNDSRCISDE